MAIVVAGTLALTACGGATEAGSAGQTQQASPGASGQAQDPSAGQQEMPKPDLNGIPDVVAEVNGTKITKEDFTTAYEAQFQQMAMQSQMMGQEVDQEKLKKQTAEGIVGTELLIQEAGNRGLEASQKETDKALDEIVKTNQLKSKDEFMAAMEKQGMDEAKVTEELKNQVMVEKLIAEEAGDTKPTDKELKAAYEEAKKQQEQMAQQGGQGAEMPSFEESKPQLEQQLKSQKEGEIVQALAKDLRAKADVKIHV
ncbi:SurA N-terminal domain-containing protein [Crystallibacter crystallopoietes]|uniref:SurA N-terminal domain-containing protein n=1 Tax=Crystallibacter crystallopoietes TaxID=37928 RepID=UPI00192BA8D6|nr:SurA N-terminal domain-containing protein [Arthrobacter crystallopoietes]